MTLPGLVGVAVLPVTAALGDEGPAVLLDEADHVADFHFL
jgi:hypothetical protein